MNIKYPNLVSSPLDYSNNDNWMVKQDNGNAKVDVFYLYPTAANPKCDKDVADVDQVMKTNAAGNFERGPSCFESIANIYAPYYRQISAKGIVQAKTAYNFFQKIYNSEVRTDAYAALDYYFEHFNKGKPFILASHSQGSATMLHIVGEYMKLHPEYYSRMIVGYILGMTCNNKYLQQYPHVKIAKGETDTGVIVSWNIEAPNATMDNFPVIKDAINCINPLNWKTDDTYAPINLNKGSYDINQHKVIEGVADAQIDLKRMVLVTKTAMDKGYQPLPAKMVLFGDKSYHFDDWNFFYCNIKENAVKRIEAWFNTHK